MAVMEFLSPEHVMTINDMDEPAFERFLNVLDAEMAKGNFDQKDYDRIIKLRQTGVAETIGGYPDITEWQKPALTPVPDELSWEEKWKNQSPEQFAYGGMEEAQADIDAKLGLDPLPVGDVAILPDAVPTLGPEGPLKKLPPKLEPVGLAGLMGGSLPPNPEIELSMMDKFKGWVGDNSDQLTHFGLQLAARPTYGVQGAMRDIATSGLATQKYMAGLATAEQAKKESDSLVESRKIGKLEQDMKYLKKMLKSGDPADVKLALAYIQKLKGSTTRLKASDLPSMQEMELMFPPGPDGTPSPEYVRFLNAMRTVVGYGTSSPEYKKAKRTLEELQEQFPAIEEGI